MGLDVTYRLCSVPKIDLGAVLFNAVTKVTSQKRKKQQGKKSANEIQC